MTLILTIKVTTLRQWSQRRFDIASSFE